MRVMKAYVNYFDTDGARARVAIHADDIRDHETVVQFSNSPEHWKMGRFEAEGQLRHLESRPYLREKLAAAPVQLRD